MFSVNQNISETGIRPNQCLSHILIDPSQSINVFVRPVVQSINQNANHQWTNVELKKGANERKVSSTKNSLETSEVANP